MNKAIHIENLKKTYPASWRKKAKEALRGVSLSIDEGETFGFIGPNGAGKSTLIKILIGSLRPTSGSSLLFGIPSRNPASRLGLGFVPENPSLQEFLTPYEILQMGLRLHRVRISDERRYCLEWLDRFELSSVADSPLRGFSKGMLQRTALAHAMAIKPRLLVLDEPLSGLDPVGRRDVVEILSEYRQQGGSLFFSSHVLFDVERIADRFGLIHEGRLLTIRAPQELVADQSDHYVLRYRGSVSVAGAEEARPGLYVVETRGDDLASLISQVRERGGAIQDVQPKVSLETVFFRTIASSSDGNA